MHNDILDIIFNYSNPDTIANILINEISLIINCIIPAKRIQCYNKFALWIDEEYIHQSKVRDDMHSKAKISDSQDDW